MPKPAASFDFVGATTEGYKFTWRHRKTVAWFSLPLLLVKFATYIIVTSFGLDISVLRQGLMMIPTYFIEGWFLAVLIRLYLSPRYLSGEGTRAVLASTLIYVLIKLFLAVTTGMTILSDPSIMETPGADVPPPTLGMFVAAFIALAAMVWAFRLLWYYIPAAMGYSLREFTDRIAGLLTSFYMLGTWFMCLLPVGMILILFSQLLLSTVPEGVQPNALYHFILLGAQAVVEILIAVISTIAMTEGIRQILFEPKKNRNAS